PCRFVAGVRYPGAPRTGTSTAHLYLTNCEGLGSDVGAWLHAIAEKLKRQPGGEVSSDHPLRFCRDGACSRLPFPQRKPLASDQIIAVRREQSAGGATQHSPPRKWWDSEPYGNPEPRRGGSGFMERGALGREKSCTVRVQ